MAAPYQQFSSGCCVKLDLIHLLFHSTFNIFIVGDVMSGGCDTELISYIIISEIIVCENSLTLVILCGHPNT